MRTFEVGFILLLLAGCSGPRALDTNSWLDETSSVKVYARGVHVYVSRPSPDQEGISHWQLKSVAADLYDAAGSRIGRQSSPATWEATDKSKVMGKVLAVAASPTLGAVPWIRYAACSNLSRGLFADVTQVRRVFTWGGKAPRSPSGETRMGDEVHVRFGATYYFQRGDGLASSGDASLASSGPLLAERPGRVTRREEKDARSRAPRKRMEQPALVGLALSAK